MLRGALVGLGQVALHGHLPGWQGCPDARLVAATDVQPAARTAWEARMPGARWHASAAALLDDDGLDFVDICTPPATHAALIRAALERGLHVLCEKPLVTAPDDLPALVDLARDRKLVLHTVHNWHHAPIVRRTGELVHQGVVGRVTRVEWRTLRTEPARTSGDAGGGNWRVDPAIAGGGVLTDHGWHVAYVVAAWLGAWPTAVQARLETRRHTRLAVEDTATVRLTFPGATAEILLTWAAAARENWACVTGTEGVLELADDTLVLHRGGTTERWPCPPALSAGSTHADWFGPVAAGFVDAIRRGAPEAGNVAEATLCLRVETLARESSRRGGIDLPLPAATALRPA